MTLRLLQFTLLIGLAACSNSNKETVSSAERTTEAESIKPDEGVIIQAQTEVDTLKGSLKAYTTERIGNTNVAINYYSPATRGRMIWGGLVAYNQVWVTGAHKATNIEFDHNIKINDTLLPAGKYAFFTIPTQSHWTIIINKNWNQHLADDYNQAEDVIRISVTPETKDTHQERLRYFIETDGGSKGNIKMHWDKLEVTINLVVEQQ